MATEVPLVGPMDNAGRVVRVGDTVRRPVTPASAAVRALLLHLEDVGFDGAPRWLGTDERGRDVLSYLDGEVPQPPYPAWSLTDEALADLGRLVRRLHEATGSLDRTGLSGWATDWCDPDGGPVVCHNDLFPENVVFRRGRVVGLIDFAMAAPGRPLWDVAIAASVWAPLSAPETRLDHPRDLDAVAHLRVLARAYGVEPEQAAEAVELLFAEREHALATIRAELAAGNQVWIDRWRDTDGDRRAAVDQAWLDRRRPALLAALGDDG